MENHRRRRRKKVKKDSNVISFDLNKKQIIKLLVIIAFALFLYWSLENTSKFTGVLGKIVSVFMPIILGCSFAFILNLIMTPIEKLWCKIFKKSKSKLYLKFKRPIGILFSILILFGVVSLLFFIVIPKFVDSATNFVNTIPEYARTIQRAFMKISYYLNERGIDVPNILLNPKDITAKIENIITDQGADLINKTVSITTSIFSWVVDTILALVFSIYILAKKETLGNQAKRIIYSIFKKQKSDKIMYVVHLVDKSFTNFFAGQVVEAFVIGTLCFIGMTIFKFPFAPVISVVIGFMAIIPIFGAFIGTAIGALLILLESPVKAFWFVIFIIVLQQIESNTIYPKVVGKSVGLPGMWVLAAVTIGGSAFGFVGMIASVPIFSVIYTLTREKVNSTLEKEKIEIK